MDINGLIVGQWYDNWMITGYILWLRLTVCHGKIQPGYYGPSISIRAMASMAMLVITRG
jgi:hypothetical protein